MSTETFRLVVVSAGTSDPSATRLLADRTAERAAALAARHGNSMTVDVIELRELAAAFDNMADTLDYEDKIRRDLVASVAHELRTPVAVLQAGHEALLDGLLK